MDRPPKLYDYLDDGQQIYRRSFDTIRDEADLDGVPAGAESVAVRMIHAAGDVDITADLRIHPRLVPAARAALQDGKPLLVDATMIDAGITRRRLPADNRVICRLHDPRVAEIARAWGTTRSAAAVSLWTEDLDGAVVAIGNAPTALFTLLELIAAGAPRPAAIIGVPVGFVGSAESKQACAENPFDIPYLVVEGRRGGSAMAASAINALAREAEL
ncbi:precorrin-8X methylmutase [Microlunatus soli]|uniref:Precorrin-8X methylmutase n=1 Tax=Microlunatus soli TaxID=630515 RepID=A0A1H1ZGD1_9ACTN|nr:precorrin-8X methylmutase [Microlunatus soli]SDT32764.1 precorrin-8X methylmutase [Microlunatus soli]